MKILMLSHVDAHWIKQRPHFFAEALSEAGHDVCFAYARAYERSSLRGRGPNCRTRALFVVPNRLRRFTIFRLVDGAAQVLWALVMIRAERPSIVWLTAPRLSGIANVIQRLSRVRVVYDYMDRNALFDGASPSLALAEAKQFRSADLILCSSSALLQDVERLGSTAPSLLVRNALADPSAWRVAARSPAGAAGMVTLGYAGTISSWFDMTLILRVLDQEPGWEMRLWGPTDVEVPQHPRLIAEGVAPHDQLPGHLGRCDVLVMPFVVTQLIEAVDPVKGYEYVATGLPVVLPRYGETEHFEPWAHRYVPGDASSFVRAIKDALHSEPSAKGRSGFADANTWTRRVAAVNERLARLE